MSDTPSTEQDIVDATLEIESIIAADHVTEREVSISLWIRASNERDRAEKAEAENAALRESAKAAERKGMERALEIAIESYDGSIEAIEAAIRAAMEETR